MRRSRARFLLRPSAMSNAALADALGLRYGGRPPEGVSCDWNATLETLLAHRSVRSYAPEPIPAGTARLLVAAAQSAPSSSNLQAWSVVAVREPARKSRLAQLAGGQRHIEEAPLFLVWLADLARLERVSTQTGRAGEALAYLESFLLAAVDAALAAQNALVAAESLGLGGVYIGALRNRPEEVAAEVGAPKGVFPLFGLCIGRPAGDGPVAAVKPRLPQEAVLHEERYRGGEAQDAAIAAYDDVMKAFYRAQRMPASEGWSVHTADRVATAGALKGRDRLRAALVALGFPLR